MDYYFRGFAMQTWYSETIRLGRKRFGKDWPLFAALLAATSPRKQIKANFDLAMRIYRAHINGEPWQRIKGIVERALSGQPLSGNKVRAFYENLVGNPDAVTIDVWVMRHFGIDKKTLSDREYAELSNKIRKTAKKEGLTPAEYQAIIWTLERRKAGFKPRSFIPYLAQGELF